MERRAIAHDHQPRNLKKEKRARTVRKNIIVRSSAKVKPGMVILKGSL